MIPDSGRYDTNSYGRTEGSGLYDYPEGYVYMNFYEASLEINNLGGYCDAGIDGGCTDKSGDYLPDDGKDEWDRKLYNMEQEILYFKDIGTVRPVGCVATSGKPCTPIRVDLKVEVAAGSDYRPNNGEYLNGWGKSERFGQNVWLMW